MRFELRHTGLVLFIYATSLLVDNVQAVIYDCGVNVDALTLLFDKGHIPMIPLPNLSDCVKDQIGFPALCLSFPKTIQDEEVLAHFKPVLDIVHNIPGIVVKSKKTVVLPDLVPKEQDSSIEKREPKNQELGLKSPFITLLKRESTKDRAFHPPTVQKQTKEDDFKGDFISFGGEPKAKKAKKSSYQKTKMEIMM